MWNLSSQNSISEDSCHLGCYALLMGKQLLAFQRINTTFIITAKQSKFPSSCPQFPYPLELHLRPLLRCLSGYLMMPTKPGPFYFLYHIFTFELPLFLYHAPYSYHTPINTNCLSNWLYLQIIHHLHVHVTTVSMEMQQWVPLALLSRHKIFCTAMNNKCILDLQVKSPVLSNINQIWNFSIDFLKSPQHLTSQKSVQSEPLNTCRQADGHDKPKRCILLFMKMCLKANLSYNTYHNICLL